MRYWRECGKKEWFHVRQKKNDNIDNVEELNGFIFGTERFCREWQRSEYFHIR